MHCRVRRSRTGHEPIIGIQVAMLEFRDLNVQRSGVPRKLRELIKELHDEGFEQIRGGKGSHRKFVHSRYPEAGTLSGPVGADAQHY